MPCAALPCTRKVSLFSFGCTRSHGDDAAGRAREYVGRLRSSDGGKLLLHILGKGCFSPGDKTGWRRAGAALPSHGEWREHSPAVPELISVFRFTLITAFTSCL